MKLKQKINEYMKIHGLEMSKQIRPASYGLFFSRPAQYEYMRAFSLEEEQDLSKRGFYVDEDMGIFVYNALTDAVY